MCATWDEIDKRESEHDYDEEIEFLNCFMAVSNEVPFLNSNLDNCIDENDIPSYDDLSHAFSANMKT